MEFNLSFYKDKKVLVTGHTGFKGSWLCHFLHILGAKVVGYSLYPPTNPSLYEIAQIWQNLESVVGDVRNYQLLQETFDNFKPEIVFHLAAQPIVRESYNDPVTTYSTNVMGTVNLLECIRKCGSVKSVINVTTDKVYENNEWVWGYRENESLNGYDPYSNSKSCSELVTSSYKKSFLNSRGVAVSTVRAGNVIGGGDFANDRIVPDCIRAAFDYQDISVRNPYSTRPYQHVIEPIYAYLMIAARQYENPELADSYNVGPDDADCFQTGQLVEIFVKLWGDNLKWVNVSDEGPHEANFLKLDCSKIKSTFGWHPRWDLPTAVAKTIEWSKKWCNNDNIPLLMTEQINNYLSEQ